MTPPKVILFSWLSPRLNFIQKSHLNWTLFSLIPPLALPIQLILFKPLLHHPKKYVTQPLKALKGNCPGKK